MKRSSFLQRAGLGLGACTLACAAPAFAGLDEAAIGRQVFAQLRDDGEVLFDSPFYEHVNEVGQIVSRTVRARYPAPVHFYIVKGDSPNAFSVPGGNIYINEPLLRMAKNRDELGGVLAHESGHMVLHHVAKAMANANAANTLTQIGSIAGQILLGPIASMGSDYALGNLADRQHLNLSRHIEAQADEEGARIVAASGELNPYGMVWFFQTMIEKYGDKGTYWQRTHPFDGQRVADLQHLFATEGATFAPFKDTKQRGETYW